jgi:UDP-glucose 4-epimerase
MNILVTGASGFLGRALAEGLHRAGGYDVVGLSRTVPQDACGCGMRRVRCDLTGEISIDCNVDYIVHCAALQEPAGMPVREFVETNLAMTANVLQFARRAGARGIVFTSSVALHGDVRGGRLDETTDRINPSVYGVSKYLCELLLQEFQAAIPTVALRLCGVVGPGADKCWIARVLAKAVRGEEIGIVNGAAAFNNVMHTDDLLRFLRVLFANGFSGFTAFPIASHSPLSVREAVTELLRASGSTSGIVDHGDRAGSFVISNSFAMDHFQYEPTAVADNLKKFARQMGSGRSCPETEH